MDADGNKGTPGRSRIKNKCFILTVGVCFLLRNTNL